MEGCVFCEIASNAERNMASIIYEDDECIVVPDMYPSSYGHLLVISKGHYENMIETPDDMVCHAFKIAKAFAKVQVAKLNAEAVNVATNIGELAGQIIMHFHVHVIPRYGHDNSHPGFKEHAEISDEYRAEMKRLLSA